MSYGGKVINTLKIIIEENQKVTLYFNFFMIIYDIINIYSQLLK